MAREWCTLFYKEQGLLGSCVMAQRVTSNRDSSIAPYNPTGISRKSNNFNDQETMARFSVFSKRSMRPPYNF